MSTPEYAIVSPSPGPHPDNLTGRLFCSLPGPDQSTTSLYRAREILTLLLARPKLKLRNWGTS